MRKYLPLVLSGALLLGGCSTGSPLFGTDPLALFGEIAEKGKDIEDKTFNAAASAIDQYCINVPEDLRLYLRDGVNSRTEHGNIAVTCD